MIDATPPALKQMIDVFEEVQGPVLAIERVPRENVSSYGIIDAEEIRPGVYRIRDMVEKPPNEEAPSDLAIIGRYILTPDIFPALEATASDRTGEIQLTNGLRRLLKDRPIYGCRIDGVRHDTGNKLGFLKAVVYFAMRRPDIASEFGEYLRGLRSERGRRTLRAGRRGPTRLTRRPAEWSRSRSILPSTCSTNSIDDDEFDEFDEDVPLSEEDESLLLLPLPSPGVEDFLA